MEKYPLLSKSPVQEAVVDIRVKLPPHDFSLSELDLHEQIIGLYPGKEEIREDDANKNSLGFEFHSVDVRQIVQFRNDGFTFSRFSPYTSWADIRSEVSKLWSIYNNAVHPVITRVATRYINRINIPGPDCCFEDYLSAPPVVPKNLPQGIVGFINKIKIFEPEINAIAIITQDFEPVVRPDVKSDYYPLILDIDVFTSTPDGIDESTAWDLLEKLRNFKNRVFFDSITDKLKEMLI
jgi:uncharacterized protein (TIGR04255 family)